MRVAVLSLEPEMSESWYVRILAPMAALRDQIELLLGARLEGCKVSIDPRLIDRADVVLVQNLFPTRATWPELEILLDSGKPVVYETDELLIEPDLTQPHPLRARLCAPYIKKLMRAATLLTVPSSELRDALAPYNSSVQVIPDCVHEPLWHQPARIPREPVVLGFYGGCADPENLAMIEEALRSAHTRLGDRVRLVLIGCSSTARAELPDLRMLPEPADYPSRAQTILDARIDVALTPLRDTPNQRCRSHRRWLEYSVAGIPGLYADLPPYRDSIQNGQTGLLVGPSAREWADAVEKIVTDIAWRESMARDAQREVLAHHTVAAGAARLAIALQEAIAGPAPPRSRGSSDGQTAHEWLGLGQDLR